MKRMKKKLRKIRAFLIVSWYTLFYYYGAIKENWVFIDSKNGKDLGSNMLRIAQELTNNPEYGHLKVFITCNDNKRAAVQKMVQQYHLKGVKLLREGRFRYAKAIARSKFLFTDTSFPAWYTRREDQVITNTWHGTPIKMMGKDVEMRAYDMGNVQRNMLMADYLTYPSDYMKDAMGSAYFIDKLYRGKILCSGYPRNCVFFQGEHREQLKRDLKLDGKKLYGYMPTWRGTLKQIDSQQNTDQMEYFFQYLDARLEEDELLLVRLHPFISDRIKYDKYEHIRPFPEGYEPYDILNICDCMITDYSSVMFDFANAGKKIVLFIYDYEFYMDERGVYTSISNFPFPQVRNVKNLLDAVRGPMDYDDSEFRAKFCTYDSVDTTQKLCRHVIKGIKEYEELTVPDDGKENVLIYGGGLGRNGITTALLSLLEEVDTKKRNYFVTFRSNFMRKEPERVLKIPEGIGFIPIPNVGQQSLSEKLACRKFYYKNQTGKRVMKKVDRFYKRLYRRYYGHLDFSWAIHFFGYERDTINMFQQADAKRAIFVHNDMISEIRTKGNQHEPTIRRAYDTFERVIPVTQDIYDFTHELGGSEQNLRVVNNCHNYQGVLEKAEMPLEFDSFTQCNVLQEELEAILDSDAKKFITIGRFSGEKGHDLLLKAFDRYHAENPNSYLIIIGGYGKLYAETKALANSLDGSDHIVIIQAISNPMAILKKCDLFVLSSRYEALGLVLLEADTLGIPVVSTDIPGPRGFMKEHGGYLVPLSEEGVYEGLVAFDEGKISPMHVDYEAYNQHAVAQFENLFEEDA